MTWVVLERGDDGPLPIGPFDDEELAAAFAEASSEVTGLEYEVEPVAEPDRIRLADARRRL